MSSRPRPIVLTILDGWGYAPAGPANAISLARKPTYDHLLETYANTLIHTSGPFVGLPEGQMGNSEVGHLNIGAGRIVQMDVTRIDAAIADGTFEHNPVLVEAMKHARTRQLHLLGLVSDGGVHSHINHLFALLRMAKTEGVEKVFVHCFMDGRDTLPTNGKLYLEQLRQKMAEYGVGKIASISGRYYAMDRDRRWVREKLAFDAMVHGAGVEATDPVQAMVDSYNRDVTDEFVIPVVIKEQGQPVGLIRDEDAVIFFNFRADRARQMTRILTRSGGADTDLEEVIPAREIPKRLHYVCMTRYDRTFTLPMVVPPESLAHILGQEMGERDMRNLRVAETEKYAHVTYFFNGGVETPFPGEERELVASPKVATYDLKPEMSAEGIANVVTKAVDGGTFDLLVVNFANADMVGHSGKIEPTVKAVETVDACLARIYKSVLAQNGAMLITADHGNAEQMIDPVSGGPQTAHTTNPVPFILVQETPNQPKPVLRKDGSLRDIAPTILGLMGLPEPKEMTGRDMRVSS